MIVTLNHVLLVSAALFSIGLLGALSKRNAIAIIMGIELMLNAGNVALVGASRFVQPLQLHGNAFAVFVLTVAAAEAALGLGILFSIYRRRETIDADRISLMRW